MTARPKPKSIAEYITMFSPEVRAILERIRATVRKASPAAEEKISYRMPAFTFDDRILIYFAAFKRHIGLYPPVKGNEKLIKQAAPYAGPKGNLRFPLSEPIPYGLVSQIVKFRVKQLRDRSASRRAAKTR